MLYSLRDISYYYNTDTKIIMRNEDINKKCQIVLYLFKANRISSILCISIICFYWAISNKVQTMLRDSTEFVTICTFFYDAINDSFILNTWCFICLMGLFLHWCYLLLMGKNPSSSIQTILFCFILLIILWKDVKWDFASVLFGDYQIWCSILLITLIISSTIRFVRWILLVFREPTETGRGIPFSTDIPQESSIYEYGKDKYCWLYYVCRPIVLFYNYLRNKIRKNEQLNKPYKEISHKRDGGEEDLNNKFLSLYPREVMADNLIERLVNTDVSKEPFAICISGPWGSGKTTFLNYMRTYIKKSDKDFKPDIEVINFNPWDSSSSSQIIDDFFNSLAKSVAPIIPELNGIISNYVRLVLKFAMPQNDLSVLNIGDIWEKCDEEIESSKQGICQHLSIVNQKWFIIIDDVDRLDGKEILSLLQLIRNTAKFPNLIFIVALDKQHTCIQLNSIGYKDAEKFLEKIFQVEVPLPKLECIDVIKELRNELQQNLFSGSKQAQAFLGQITSSDEQITLINSIFNNYRTLKRLVRQFSVSAMTLRRYYSHSEYNEPDLFYLEMLRYVDFSLYEILSKNSDSILLEKIDKQANAYWSLNRRSEKLKKYSSDAITILEYLFSEERDMSYDRLIYKGNYSIYFYLFQPNDYLTIASFEEMLESVINEDYTLLENKVKEWCLSDNRKSVESIYHVFWVSFGKIRSHKNSYDIMRRYLVFVMYWIDYETTYYEGINNALSIVLNGNFYKTNEDKVKAVDLFNKKFEQCYNRIGHYERAQNDIKLQKWVWALAKIYRFDNVSLKQIITNEDIEKLIKDSLLHKFLSLKNRDAQELLVSTSSLHKFVNNSIVCNPRTKERFNIVIEVLETVFCHKKSLGIYDVRSRFSELIDIQTGELIEYPDKTRIEYKLQRAQIDLIFPEGLESFKHYLDTCFDMEKAIPSETNQIKKTDR